MLKTKTAYLVVLSLAGLPLAGPTPLSAGEPHHTVVAGDGINWPLLPRGAQAAILFGNPGQVGPCVLQLKSPDGFTVPPHRHSKDEFVTVIAGKFAVGTGEKLDRSVKPLPAASFVQLPAGMAHYAWADGETVVQINGIGPFDIGYVDAKDDPRTQ